MESTHPASRLALALRFAAEQDFRDAVIDILANNSALGEKIKELHTSAGEVMQDRPSTRVKGLIEDLDKLERILTLAPNGGVEREAREQQAVKSMMHWLADQLVPDDVNTARMSGQKQILFRMVARSLFWRSVLGGYSGRMRFCSILSGEGQQTLRKDLPQLLARAKDATIQALEALKVSPDINALVSPGGGRKRGCRGRGRQGRRADDASADQDRVTADPVLELIRSSAHIDTIEETGVVTGLDPEIEIRLTPSGPRANVWLDTGCQVTTVTREFLLYMNPTTRITRLPRPSLTRGVVPNAYCLKSHFAKIELYIEATLDGKAVTACIPHEVMIAENYNCDMLLGMDLIKKHSMVVDTARDKLIIKSCRDAEVPLIVSVFHQSQVVDDPRAEKRRMKKLLQELANSRPSNGA
ncbi:hypothetical protein LTR85_008334 [Meristemomyces frigidus]|nr:hypothetical protein LTR85_008334 [Meristemomyces frigidus]